MPTANPVAPWRLYVASILFGLAADSQASIPAGGTAATRTLSCEFPVRLTRDCSVWQGATRPVAIGDYRMTLAADREGRKVLVSRLRPGPDHNGAEFRRTLDRRWPQHSSRDAIGLIGAALQDHGIRLERSQPLRQGRRIQAYLLEFSANAYEVLKQFTVLESEHWLPRRSRVR